jgi:predicted DNA-binding protein (MmcQ/YjbR family)
MAPRRVSANLEEQLRTFAFGLPEAWEDTPWAGDLVAKVGKKVFVFFGEGESDDGSANFSVKLPASYDEAMALPFTENPGYGLDRGKWVAVHAPPDTPPEMLTAWIEESYRAVAPKALRQRLEG